MLSDNDRIQKLLQDKGCSVTKIKEQPYPTPDFKVQVEKQEFFCEVKSIHGDEWEEGERSDPTFNNIANKIHEAVKQFRSVNPDRELPNVLVLCNHRDECDSLDLEAVLTGLFHADDGTKHKIYGQYSDGKIKEEKLEIDLYVWLTKKNIAIGRFTTEKGKEIIIKAFGVPNQREI